MRRRTLLRAAGLGGAAGVLGTAGCLGRVGVRGSAPETPPPPQEDPPDAVYRPSSVSGTRLVGVADDGPFRFGLRYSLPSRFWELVGRTGYRRDPVPEDSLHLMATVWDPESGLVLPEVGLTTEVRRDGDLVTEEAVYAMLSQRLGFHYGDNFALPGDGQYTVRIRVGGLQIRRTGAFADRLDDPAAVEVPLQFEAADRAGLERRPVTDAGRPGAVEPSTVSDVPNAAARSPAALPGTHRGRVRTGDAVLDVLTLDGEPAARFDAETYLAVVARTPYNGMVLPAMGLRATLDGTAHRLVRTVDPDLGYHYGVAVADLPPGERLTLTTTTPPQVARHEGYETAFVEMPPVTLTL
jgi:hypothetical protein